MIPFRVLVKCEFNKHGIALALCAVNIDSILSIARFCFGKFKFVKFNNICS